MSKATFLSSSEKAAAQQDVDQDEDGAEFIPNQNEVEKHLNITILRLLNEGRYASIMYAFMHMIHDDEP